MQSPSPAPRAAWWLAALQIQPGEERRTGWMVALHLALSFGYVFLQSAAFGLFVSEFGPQGLPFAYIAIAFVASLIAFLYLRLAERLAFARLLTVNIAFLALGSALFWIGLATPLARAFTFFLPVWFQVMVTLGNLAIWSLAGRVFDLRQGKRLFALIGAGNWTANSLAALVVPPLVVAVGTTHLLLGAALCTGLTLVILRRVTRAFLPPEPARASRAPAGAPARREPLAANRYVRLIFGYTVFWWIAFYFVDNIFFDRAAVQFPDAAQLTSFVGALLSGMGIVALVTTTFVSARVLGRFGLAAGLMSMPALTLALLGGLALGAALGVPPFALFVLATAAKLFNVALGFSLSQSASVIVYQAVPERDRMRVQTTTEGVVQPIAVGLAGISLLVLNTWLRLGAGWLAAAFVVLGLGMLIAAWRISREYPHTLAAALSRRQWGDAPHAFSDPQSAGVLQRALRDPHPEAVIYALHRLEALGDPGLPLALRELLAHPAAAVRREALERMERLAPPGAGDTLRDHLERESDPVARGAALRAWLAVDPGAAYAAAVRALEEPEPFARRAALIGLLRYGGIDGVLAAGQAFNRLLESPDPAERVLAATVLAQADVTEFYAPALRLLEDEDVAVRRAALRAAGHIAHPRLWHAVLAACDSPLTLRAAVAALAAGGDSALGAIAEAFADPAAPRARLIGMAQACAQLRAPRAVPALLTRLASDDGEVRSAILNALWACAYRTGDPAALRPHLHAELAHAARIASHLLAFASEPRAVPLSAALRRELDFGRARVLAWLAFTADAQMLRQARGALARGTQQAYALEVIDTQTPADLKEAIMPLMEDLPPAARLERWHAQFPQADETAAARLRALIAGEAPIRVTPWTVVCALHAAGALGAAECADAVASAQDVPDARVREAARGALARLRGDKKEGGLAMLSTVEKVLILKTVGMFSQTPDEVLADVADLLEPVDCATGETLMRMGEPGDSLYIIVDGRVSVREGEVELTTLGARDVVGEMALLDTEPRSATVLALEPTHLLRLAQAPFYELVEQRPEVAVGVLLVLVRRLRQLNRAQATTNR